MTDLEWQKEHEQELLKALEFFEEFFEVDFMRIMETKVETEEWENGYDSN